ncbi:hypothetical protein FB451DRAFT_1562609 [Mycena latifolia]|nr:hypothetical protein FB451DRAFT_1562609 [Mycena latifolia]
MSIPGLDAQAPTGLSSSELFEDVILLILEFCDISTVLRLGQTSRYFHQLASSKSVWLSLTTDLVRRGFIDRRPGELFSEFSTEELVRRVKHVTLGPRTWAHDYPYAPVVTRKITLSLPTANDSWNDNEAKLLPGGEYVFLEHGVLDCWSVAEERVVWTHRCSVQEASVVTFAAQLTDRANEAVIMTCHRTGGAYSCRKNFVEVTTLDLISRTSRSVHVVRVPDTIYDGPYAQPSIYGDIAVVAVSTEVILINWRTGCCVTVQIDGECHNVRALFRLTVAPQYAILVLPGPLGEERVVVSPLAALPWAPINASNTPASLIKASDLLTVHDERISFDGHTSTVSIQSSVLESPVQRDLFRVWIHLVGDGGVALLSYNFRLQGGVTDWRHRATMSAREVLYWGIPFSGHTFEWTRGSRDFVVLNPHDIDRRLQLIGWTHGPGHISAYTGALTYSTLNSLVVLYFE